MGRRRHRKVKTQEEESTESKVEKLKLWREEIDWEIEEERHRFLYKLEPLIWNWKRQLPNLRDFFRPEEIDLLLLDALTFLTKTRMVISSTLSSGLDTKTSPTLAKTASLVHCCVAPRHCILRYNECISINFLIQMYLYIRTTCRPYICRSASATRPPISRHEELEHVFISSVYLTECQLFPVFLTLLLLPPRCLLFD
ncbi:unnamed protein product [Trichogramma brassicae]|uniref:Uncharacterized protein n=1 Tax=Trichogramma brassicae TaxID=86971 RepID=A0A6H5IDB3_9HYME|nr:unnamed protein product [Trichogramma brassicae]